MWPKRVHRERRRRFAFAPVGDVAACAIVSVARQATRGLFGGVGIEIEQQHARAVLGEQLRASRARARAGWRRR